MTRHRMVDYSQARHPDVQGVSVGAILSSYQRVRVEHVLVTLNPLTDSPLISLQMQAPRPHGSGVPVAKGTG